MQHLHVKMMLLILLLVLIDLVVFVSFPLVFSIGMSIYVDLTCRIVYRSILYKLLIEIVVVS